MHLIIYFNGTGDNGKSLTLSDPSNNAGFHYADEQKVKTIIVRGCQDKEVCNANVFPNLSDFAKRFVGKLFATNNANQLTLKSTDFASLKIGIDTSTISTSSDATDKPIITAITLSGYSRGAVTCFNVAKELHKIAPLIPVNIVANQPVPGNIYQFPCSNAAAVADCRHLTNLRNVSIIVGSYTGEKDIDVEGTPKWIHRLGFSQIIPKLPSSKKCNSKVIVIPRRNHNSLKYYDESFGDEQLNQEIANNLRTEGSLKNNLMPDITPSYSKTAPLPPQHTLQSFFGMRRRDAYRHVDPHLNRPFFPEGMKKANRQPYMQWWQSHDKYASYFSSTLTKKLVHQIKETDKAPNNVEALKTLYHQAEHWLAMKNGTKTSRYYQVIALRDNLYDHLKGLMPPHQDIFNEHYEQMQKHGYLLQEWRNLSSQASSYKSFDTHKLDHAFEIHSRDKKPSEQNDTALLMALDRWLSNKEGSKSKRYELVKHFHNRLKTIIEKVYKPSQQIQLTSSNASSL